MVFLLTSIKILNRAKNYLSHFFHLYLKRASISGVNHKHQMEMKKNYILLLTAILAGYWIGLNGQSAPRQGEILITEIMVNPEAVSDANGEWVEIWNSTDHDLL